MLEKDDVGCIEVSYTVDPEDMDAASFCLGAAAVGLNIGANIPNEAVMHGALVVAAQAALTAGYSAEQFRSICSTIEFMGKPHGCLLGVGYASYRQASGRV